MKMSWSAAHKINDMAFKLGAGWEDRIMQMFLVLTNDKELSQMNKLMLLVFLQEELDRIAAEELNALNNVTTLSYRHTLNSTIGLLHKIPYTNPSLAMGYSSRWCKDGKDYPQRVVDNINAIKDEIAGLLLGFNSDDPIMLMGLIYDIITKAENEWRRLIRTEIEAAYSQGARDANLMKGAVQAVVENSAPCDAICAEMVGEHEVPLRGVIGLDLPPQHPNCHCTFVGLFSDDG